ncbi:MAG: DUF4202 domain-containing protein [Bacteroidota bacterium]
MLTDQQEQAALAAFDHCNAQDPRQQIVEGQLHPYALIYGQRMTEQLALFAPTASQALRLAARAQHLERWVIPRQDYPMDRPGYLRWRNALKAYHARRAGEILAEVGAEEELIGRVAFLLQKKQLKRDAETQTLEDVICLVFLEHYAEAFAAQHTEEKVTAILQKTWRKMSVPGQEAALRLKLPAGVSDLVGRALVKDA